jgi:hypothetical protein
MIRGVAEASKIVGVDKQQIKNWSHLFRECLSKEAKLGQEKRRQYNEKDILNQIQILIWTIDGLIGIILNTQWTHFLMHLTLQY